MKISLKSLQGKELDYAMFTGEVLENREWSETEVSSTMVRSLDGKSMGHDVHSTTYENQAFWMKLDNGKERQIRLTDVPFACRVGHTISVLWVGPHGGNGMYVAGYNHATEKRTDWLGQRSPLLRALFNKKWFTKLSPLGCAFVGLGLLSIVGIPLVIVFFIYRLVTANRRLAEFKAGVSSLIDTVSSRA